MKEPHLLPTGLTETVDLNKVDWEQIKHDFDEYRNSLDGVKTVSALFYFLEKNHLSPFATREKVFKDTTATNQ